MKKTAFFAAMAATVMLCGAVTVPAAAEETTYRMGDVNMDGEISVEDAMLVLREYTEYTVVQNSHILKDAQLKLADVIPDCVQNVEPDEVKYARLAGISAADAQAILCYYTQCVADPALKDTEISVWYRRDFNPLKEPPAVTVPPRNPDYAPGDVDMDGMVDASDAQILFVEYLNVVIGGEESTLTPEQIALGDVYPNTAQDDPEDFMRKMGYGQKQFSFEAVATDYPISWQDSLTLLAYYTNLGIVGGYRYLDLFTADDYARYYGIPPVEEQEQFKTQPLTRADEGFPTDSVTVPGFRDFAVNPENWAMQSEKVTKPGDFTFWYDGTGEFEGREILISGTNRYKMQKYEFEIIAALEQATRNETMKLISLGDTAIYRTIELDPAEDSENWREEEKLAGRAALKWKSGAYWITVYTQEQFPDEVLDQIISCFVPDPVK